MKRFDILAKRLQQSPDVCRQRQGRDLEHLLEMIAGPWSKRLRLNDVRVTGDNGLYFMLRLDDVRGLVCENGNICPLSSWKLGIKKPRSYPHHGVSAWLSGPEGEKAFNPHALHPEQLISELDLTTTGQRAFASALQGREQGRMCFLDRWTPDWHTHNLVVVVWQLSRCITGTSFHPEQFALNNVARDYYLRLKQKGELPLGSPLSHPWPFDNENHVGAVEEADFEFIAENS
jgi:hypothetical protein